jgi:hypothetical protein
MAHLPFLKVGLEPGATLPHKRAAEKAFPLPIQHRPFPRRERGFCGSRRRRRLPNIWFAARRRVQIPITLEEK